MPNTPSHFWEAVPSSLNTAQRRAGKGRRFTSVEVGYPPLLQEVGDGTNRTSCRPELGQTSLYSCVDQTGEHGRLNGFFRLDQARLPPQYEFYEAPTSRVERPQRAPLDAYELQNLFVVNTGLERSPKPQCTSCHRTRKTQTT